MLEGRLETVDPLESTSSRHRHRHTHTLSYTHYHTITHTLSHTHYHERHTANWRFDATVGMPDNLIHNSPPSSNAYAYSRERPLHHAERPLHYAERPLGVPLKQALDKTAATGPALVHAPGGMSPPAPHWSMPCHTGLGTCRHRPRTALVHHVAPSALDCGVALRLGG